MKILETSALIVLTGISLLVILIIFGMDNSHDNTIGFFERSGMLLIPGFFIVLAVIRLKGK